MMKSALMLSAAALLASAEKVQVYVLMGQSNMLGEGNVVGTTNGTLEFAVNQEKKYQYLLDSQGKEWNVLSNVYRNVFVMGSGNQSFETAKIQHNEWMGVNTTIKKTIGPEIGIGFKMYEKAKTTPTMFLKSCIGNRALGWDLLPPGQKSWDYTDSKGNTKTYAGYHESPASWPKGTTPKPIGWMAGIQYDGDVNRSKQVLANLQTFYPGATDYEVAGFFWWQGDRDRYDPAYASTYETHLVALIEALRKDFNAPNAKFVIATLGQTAKGATGNEGMILQAELNVDGDSGKYPQYKGNVKTVYSHPLSMGGASNSHYGKNAETYMNVGEAMGEAMNSLL